MFVVSFWLLFDVCILVVGCRCLSFVLFCLVSCVVWRVLFVVSVLFVVCRCSLFVGASASLSIVRCLLRGRVCRSCLFLLFVVISGC